MSWGGGERTLPYINMRVPDFVPTTIHVFNVYSSRVGTDSRGGVRDQLLSIFDWTVMRVCQFFGNYFSTTTRAAQNEVPSPPADLIVYAPGSADLGVHAPGSVRSEYQQG